MSELCAGTLTARVMRAPRALGGGGLDGPRDRGAAPAMTTCPGALKFTASTTSPCGRLATGGLDVGILQPENGCHGALPLGHRSLHGFGAKLDQTDRGGELEAACGHQRAQLPRLCPAMSLGRAPPRSLHSR